MPRSSSPTVSVIVITLDGGDMLLDCLHSVVANDYPQDQVEVLLVDNASTDGSIARVRRELPQVQILSNDTNTGFAPAVNQAAAVANGEYLALLNNDAIAQPGWLRGLVAPMVSDDRIGSVAGLILDTEGRLVDFAGGAAAFNGHGFPLGHGEPPAADLRAGPTLFASGGSMAVRRSVWESAGGFDDDYFAFFEDVDFGWRLWVQGHEVWFNPDSVVHHRHHGTIARFGYPRERYLLEKNALATIYKNFSDETLPRVLPAAVLLTVMRAFADDGIDLPDYRIPNADGDLGAPSITNLGGSHLAALRQFGLDLPALDAKRAAVQAKRVRTDREVLPLLRHPVLANIPDEDYGAVFDNVVKTFDLLLHSTARQRILVICADRLGKKMAGPAIRSWEMSRLLSREHEVILGSLTPPDGELAHERFAIEHFSHDRVRELTNWADVIVLQGVTMWWFPEIVASDACVVVDIYDPFHIEALEIRKEESHHERWATAHSDVAVIQQQLERGDLLLCASAKQRDFWLGHLAAAGRINPATYDQSADLSGLLELAPFGLPPEPPQRTRPAIKGVVDGISDDDVVLLWGGGIYNWFDPATLIRAMALLVPEHPSAKLFFLGTAHPNPHVPKMKRAAEAYRVATDETGLLGSHVFFNEGWVDYEERANYLLDADVGVSNHFRHIETELSFRTRFLDYLWAGLPIVATEGDSLSDLVRHHGIGLTVPAEDPRALAEALERVMDADVRREMQSHIEAVAAEMTWEQALDPLLRYARMPRRARDHYQGREYPMPSHAAPPSTVGRVGELSGKFVRAAREEGLRTAVERAATHPAVQRLRRR